MLSSGLLWTVFIIYLCFLFFIATMGGFIQKHRTKNTEDFSTGSGTIRWPFLVMTYIASLMSTWVFFAGPGAYYRGGFGYWASELSYICLFPVIVHFVMNKVWLINGADTTQRLRIFIMTGSKAPCCALYWRLYF